MKTAGCFTRCLAFTLLELMVVITIIGVLSAVVVVNTKGAAPNARRAAAMADLKRIHEVAEIIHVETGRYPETIADMVGARKVDGTQVSVSLPQHPRSPWSHDYVYDISSGDPVVTCLGRDNQPGGTGEDEDLVVPAPAEG